MPETETLLLQRLFEVSYLCRKAQREYYAHRGDLKTDPIKKAHYDEARRREYDLDRLLKQLADLYPNLKALLTSRDMF